MREELELGTHTHAQAHPTQKSDLNELLAELLGMLHNASVGTGELGVGEGELQAQFCAVPELGERVGERVGRDTEHPSWKSSNYFVEDFVLEEVLWGSGINPHDPW